MQRQAFYNTAESTKIVFGQGFAPDLAGGAHDAPQSHLSAEEGIYREFGGM